MSNSKVALFFCLCIEYSNACSSTNEVFVYYCGHGNTLILCCFDLYWRINVRSALSAASIVTDHLFLESLNVILN